MPSLPSSVFWKESFYEYYCVNWQRRSGGGRNNSSRGKHRQRPPRVEQVEQQLKLLAECGEQCQISDAQFYESMVTEIDKQSAGFIWLAKPLKLLWQVYYKLPMTVCVLSMLLIYGSVLLIPIGKSVKLGRRNTTDDENDGGTANVSQLNLPMYVVFQAVHSAAYTLLSYPCDLHGGTSTLGCCFSGRLNSNPTSLAGYSGSLNCSYLC